MDTLQENEAMQNLPFREDGTVDLMELGRRQLEQMVNQIMDWQADELRGEGNRRNGYRERRLLTPVGEITLRIPKLREGSYFPDELIKPYSRVGRAMVAIVKEVYARGLSTRKIEKAADELGFGSIGQIQFFFSWRFLSDRGGDGRLSSRGGGRSWRSPRRSG